MASIEFLIVEKTNNPQPTVQFSFLIDGENLLARHQNMFASQASSFLCDTQLLYRDSEIPLNYGNFRFKLRDWLQEVSCPDIVFSVQSKFVFIKWSPPPYVYDDEPEFTCVPGSLKLEKNLFVNSYLQFREKLWEIQLKNSPHFIAQQNPTPKDWPAKERLVGKY